MSFTISGGVQIAGGSIVISPGGASPTPGGGGASNFGYTSGGSPSTNTIDKFPFASDANATDVGDLPGSENAGAAGQSSSTHGYSSGPSFGGNIGIKKFTFII